MFNIVYAHFELIWLDYRYAIAYVLLKKPNRNELNCIYTSSIYFRVRLTVSQISLAKI